ncbi:MAG: VWA domain-containing protein [Thermoanaerobaculia bacterium]
MNFGQPQALWLAWLAPIALILAALFWRRYLKDLDAWAKAGVWERLGIRFRKPQLRASIALLALAVLSVALALARPRWGTSEQTVERQGVDIVFVLDSSMSMAAPDVAPSRIGIAKSLVRRMAASLPGHRVALVQAEGEGLVLAPLTIDTAVLDLLLDTVGPGSLPRPGTQIGPALTEALKLFPPDGEKHRVLVMISDGEDHGSSWEQSLQALRDAGVVVHTLGVGTVRGSPIPVLAESQEAKSSFKKDDQGRVVVSKLNESVLERLAQETGGVYVPVSKPGVDPVEITTAISLMERRSFDSESMDVLAERFQWPLALAALALVLHLAALPLGAAEENREAIS